MAKNVENMIDIFGDEEGKKLTARNININEVLLKAEEVEERKRGRGVVSLLPR